VHFDHPKSVRSGKPALQAAALACVCLLSACADGGRPINGEQVLSPEERRLQAVENRMAELTHRTSALESNSVNSQIADDMRNLRGQVEQLRYDFDNFSRKTQDQQNDLDTRLKRLEGGAPPADANAAPGAVPGIGAGSAVPSPSVPAPPAASAAPASAAAAEEALYLKSFDQLKAGKYDDAIRGFRSMLGKYPQGSFADNGWYWTGESYRVKGDDANALKAYQSLLTQFPASPKVPDALLKTGMIYQAQQKNAPARDAFQKVLKQYPNSSAAGQARTRLAQLK
jgi:tol-pal system protein YbgF